jgi:hypothetical protein
MSSTLTQEVIVVLPKACGGWYHLPKNVRCISEPGLLLESWFGCRLGNMCHTHTTYQHFRVPLNWHLEYHDDGFVLFDHRLWARLDLSFEPGANPTLTALPFHRLYASLQNGPKGTAIVNGFIRRADGTEVFTAFKLVPIHRCATPEGRQRVRLSMAQELRWAVEPTLHDITDPFAYW